MKRENQKNELLDNGEEFNDYTLIFNVRKGLEVMLAAL